MTDLSENAPFDEVLEGSNTDTQEQSDIETVSESDAEIDAINEALAEAESDSTIAENTTVEESDEQVGNSEQLKTEPVNISDRLEEPEPQPNPWDDAPKDVYFYDKTYEDGHLGSYTESAEMAYKFGWDIEHNYILIADTEKSDVNGWTYPKELCPHKSEEQKQHEAVQKRIIEIQIAVQTLLDGKAKEKMYDNGFAIASYAASTNETFRDEAQRFIAWRDGVWSKCYEILADFESGEIEMPSVDYVMERLPTLDWT